MSDRELRKFVKEIEIPNVSHENSSKMGMRESLGKTTSFEASMLETAVESHIIYTVEGHPAVTKGAGVYGRRKKRKMADGKG